MNECPTLEQLRLWLAGRLSDADALAIKQHVRSCGSDCPQRVESLAAAANAATDAINDGNRQNDAAPSVAPRDARNPASAGGNGKAAMPRQFGRFEIVELLGKGSYGEVYRARDPKLKREVAIKLPRKGLLQEPAERERFLREARALAKIRHRNICQVFDADEWKGRQYIVMELVSGQSLETIIARGSRIGERSAAAMLRKLALALDEAHRLGIIHRDLKPSNIMIDERGRPVVMDFGLARRFDPGEATLTQTGAIVGTPAYMAPEQARSRLDEIGPATDVYALGIILYEMLTGRRPFAGNLAEVRRQIVDATPVAPSALRPGLDPRLEAICLKAIAKTPSDRFGSMRELAEALRPLVKPDAAKDPPANPLESEEFASLVAGLDSRLSVIAQRQRMPWWKWTAVALPIAFAALLGWFFIPRAPSTREVRLIVDEALRADASLSFFLDGHEITAQQAGEKMQLPFGDHLLVVKRAGNVIKSYYFVVSPIPDAAPSGGTQLAESVPLREIPGAVVAKVPDPSGHWGFDESTDASSTSVDAAKPANGSRRRAGVRGQAMLCSSAADAVTIADAPALHANAAVTLAAWVQPKSDRAGRIAGKWSSSAKGSYGLNWVDGVYSFRVAFPVGGAAGTAVEVHALGAIGDWAHVAGVYDGNRLCMYIDGQPVASQELTRSELLRRTSEFATTGRIPSTMRDSPDPFGIGGEGFQGLIDEVQLWDSALSSQQLVTLFDSFAYTPPAAVLPDARMAAAGDADRRIAEWVMSRGGSVRFPRADGSDWVDYRAIEELPKTAVTLSSVNLFDDLSPNDEDLARLDEIPHLKSLEVDHAEIGRLTDDGVIRFIQRHPQPNFFLLEPPPEGGKVLDLSDSVLEALCQCPSLAFLHVKCGNLTEKGFKCLPMAAEHLTGLGLPCASNFTDASLVHVGVLPWLNHLNLSYTGVTDAGICKLPQLLNIPDLVLWGTRTGDPVLARLAESLSLRRLVMTDTSITDAGLEHLTRIKTLNVLYLAYTSVSDAGVPHLKRLTSLRELALTGTKLTRAGIDELRAALPGCTIFSDFGTFESLAAPPAKTQP